jgi:hypothetical protein
MSARMASGQHRMKRMHQSRKVNMGKLLLVRDTEVGGGKFR